MVVKQLNVTIFAPDLKYCSKTTISIKMAWSKKSRKTDSEDNAWMLPSFYTILVPVCQKFTINDQ